MELKNFIERSLVDIIDAIVATQDDAISKGAVICPPMRYTSAGVSNESAITAKLGPHFLIKFDIALTVKDSTTAGGEGGIKVMGVGIGGKLATIDDTTSVSRVQLEVPIVWPIHPSLADR